MFKTLAYADIFDYPLTAAELQRWQITGDNQDWPVAKTGKFFHLPGRARLVNLRRQRQRFSQLKWRFARQAARRLQLIPWIKLICVTGALAMNNSQKNDDVDLMIVTAKDRLWLTRLKAVVLLGPLLRRGNKINNRVCLNLWLDETSLALPKTQRNLYTAHEVVQAQPVFERDNAYDKFISANLWYKKYLPNWKI